jgi:protein phosphatase
VCGVTTTVARSSSWATWWIAAPKIVEAATLVMDACDAGVALCVPGNHDDKLKRALQGRNVQITHGLQDSLDQIAALPDTERDAFKERFVRSPITSCPTCGWKTAVSPSPTPV